MHRNGTSEQRGTIADNGERGGEGRGALGEFTIVNRKTGRARLRLALTAKIMFVVHSFLCVAPSSSSAETRTLLRCRAHRPSPPPSRVSLSAVESRRKLPGVSHLLSKLMATIMEIFTRNNGTPRFTCRSRRTPRYENWNVVTEQNARRFLALQITFRLTLPTLSRVFSRSSRSAGPFFLRRGGNRVSPIRGCAAFVKGPDNDTRLLSRVADARIGDDGPGTLSNTLRGNTALNHPRPLDRISQLPRLHFAERHDRNWGTSGGGRFCRRDSGFEANGTLFRLDGDLMIYDSSEHVGGFNRGHFRTETVHGVWRLRRRKFIGELS